MARPDGNFRKFGSYVRTKFQKFPQKCSDCSRHGPLKSKFVRIVHRASKKPKFVRTGPSGPENSLFLFGLAIRPKAEHESGLPAARYRYTRGKTREYVNSRIRVTRWLKPAQIQVGLPEYRVLVPSTCKYLCSTILILFCHFLIFIHSRFIFCIKKIKY